MNIQDYREQFYNCTEKVSDLNRQFAFAAIAIIWLFKIDMPDFQYIIIPTTLVTAGAFVVLSLLFDFSQYLVAGLIWRYVYLHHENLGTSEVDDLGPHNIWFERSIYFLFILKVIFMIFAYFILAKYLFTQLVS